MLDVLHFERRLRHIERLTRENVQTENTNLENIEEMLMALRRDINDIGEILVLHENRITAVENQSLDSRTLDGTDTTYFGPG